MSKPKPAEYNLQIFIDSLRNDPVLNIESSEPFNSMKIGDKFYPSGENSHWFSNAQTPRVLYIVDIAHSVNETKTAILNQLFIALSTTSPAGGSF